MHLQSKMRNLFSSIPAGVPDELVETLLENKSVRIERIVSQGHSSPEGFWYDQDESEFVVLLKGAARLRFEDGEIELSAGDSVNIPAHRRHRVEWTTPDEPTIWLAVFYDSPSAHTFTSPSSPIST
jgi:cupin 2 domain-containing protein